MINENINWIVNTSANKLIKLNGTCSTISFRINPVNLTRRFFISFVELETLHVVVGEILMKSVIDRLKYYWFFVLDGKVANVIREITTQQFDYHWAT